MCVFVAVPVTAATTLIFAAAMGFLWLGVAPLIERAHRPHVRPRALQRALPGSRSSATVGSFAGAWMGGMVYTLTGNYAIAWSR